jgi:hypothetical protein
MRGSPMPQLVTSQQIIAMLCTIKFIIVKEYIS